MKALIADDSPLLRKELREMADRTDINQVFEAADGNEALELYASERPELILLDIVMKGMDGITFLKELQKQEAGEDHTIIVITAINEASMKETVHDLGATHFIEKPVEMGDLRDAVEHARPQ